jgi:hypothetical protein
MIDTDSKGYINYDKIILFINQGNDYIDQSLIDQLTNVTIFSFNNTT